MPAFSASGFILESNPVLPFAAAIALLVEPKFKLGSARNLVSSAVPSRFALQISLFLVIFVS